jgi:hypothetical protein
VCVAVVADGDVDGLRRLVRSFCLPGQRRWHFVTERDSLIEELRRLARPQPFRYVHLPPHGDPLLWVADALAWSHSAGGTWRARIADITAAEDVSPP